jgi:hypothetical protein
MVRFTSSKNEEEYDAESENTRQRDFIFEIVAGINIPIPAENDRIITIRENSDIAINTDNALTLHILNLNRENVGTIMAMNTDTVDQVLAACLLEYPQVYKDRYLAMIYHGERPPGDATLEELGMQDNASIFIFFKVSVGDGKKKRVTKKRIIKKRVIKKRNTKKINKKRNTRKINKKRNTRKVIRHKNKIKFNELFKENK